MIKKLLLTVLLASGICSEAWAAKAYVVNNDTTYANLTYDRQWIDFFRNSMGYTVSVITDDSAALITVPSTYDGYFLSATINGANLSNLDTTSRGVVICDQLLYDDFRVASGQTAVTLLGSSWHLLRVDSTHAITDYMFSQVSFEYSANSGSYGYTGIPNGGVVLFNPSNRLWDGANGTPDTAFCYAVPAGGTLTSGTAQGRRVVALSHYALLTSQTDGGYCHPYELMGNLAGWAWGDETNTFNANYNCYSTERATNPGPEVQQSWGEFGSLTGTGRSVYYGGRTGYDTYQGIVFMNARYWRQKMMAGFEPDSLVWTYKIGYRGFGADSPPSLPVDTITLATIVSATRLTFDTTTLSQISMYDLHYMGTGRAILVRTGTGADTLQKGDTITLAGGSRAGTNDTLYYARTGAGFFNGTAASQVRVIGSDAYGGFDYWLKVYKIIPQTVWNTPFAYLNQGGNPEGSATYTWANRNFIKSGNTDSVRWSAANLAAGVDYEATALCSVRINKTTLLPDGTTTIRLKIAGDKLDDPLWNGFVGKCFDLSDASDSADIEIIPSSVAVVRGSFVQKLELYASSAAPQTLGVEDSVLTFSGYVGTQPAAQQSDVVNTGDGVIGLDSIVVSGATWLDIAPSSGNTPLTVTHSIDTTGLTAMVDTATVTVYASAATNTPLAYIVILTLTNPPAEVPPATVEKRTGLRMQ